MNVKWIKKITSLLMILMLLISGIHVVAAQEKEERSGKKSSIQIESAPLNEEYKEYVITGGKGNSISSLDLSYLSESYAKLWAQRNTYDLLPEEYDLRDYGKVPPVENQGSYGTCWAVAALSSAESSLIQQFPHLSLSIAHLAYFTYFGAEEEEYNWYFNLNDAVDTFNSGGSSVKATGTLGAWKGPVFTSQVPYEPKELDEGLRYQADYHLQDAYF